MNWDAIGAIAETLGALAVVATLIYFSLQIRNMQATAIAGHFAQMEEGEREMRILHIAHASLLLKANSGIELNEEEALILEQVYGAYQSHFFHSFGRSTSLGRDGEVLARNFAIVLRQNPSFFPLFSERRLADSPAPRMRNFAVHVQRFLDESNDG